MTLSTCAYAFENARYVVLARVNTVYKKPSEWELKQLMQQMNSESAILGGE